MPDGVVAELHPNNILPKEVIAFIRKGSIENYGKYDPCPWCGKNFEPRNWDHIVPRSQEGQRGWWNLVRTCKECNHHRGDTPMLIWLHAIRLTGDTYTAHRWLLDIAKQKNRTLKELARREAAEKLEREKIEELNRMLELVLEANERGELGGPVRKKRRKAKMVVRRR